MPQAALQLTGPDLEQPGAAIAVLRAVEETDTAVLKREAARLAKLAGEFALFGLNISQPDINFRPDQAYRADEASTATPANDARAIASQAFPDLTRRGAHLAPTVPIRFIQALDWFVVLATAEFAARWGAGMGLAELSIGAAAGFLISALCLKAGMWLTESYRVTPARIRAERGIGGLALGVMLGLVVSTAIAPDAKGAAALSAILPVAAMVLAGVHAALAVWIRAAHRKGVFAETIVLIGATDAAQRLAARAEKTGDARIIAVVDDRAGRAPANVGAAPVAGNLDSLLAWEGLPHVDRIIITVTQKAETRVRDIIERLRATPNRVDLLLDYETLSVRGRRIDRLSGAAVACVSGRPRNPARVLVKRAQDVIIGAALLAVCALPMLIIAALVKLDSKGPALYRQRRHGFNNSVITVLKFRTMRHDPGAPLRQVCADDPRVTRLGRFLRQSSLDELPQLINVLRGEMSLVGPRPHAIGMTADQRELTHIVADYAHRHRVKPGITGWAQVSGSRGPIETPEAVRRRLKLDLEYVSRASFWFDLQILVRTAPALLGDAKATR